MKEANAVLRALLLLFCLSICFQFLSINWCISSHSSTIRQKVPQLKRIVSFHRSIFQKLNKKCFFFSQRQNDVDLPPKYGFGTDLIPTALPKSNPHCVPHDLQSFLAKFIEEFYRLFDTRGRGELHTCYHDSCMLSLCISSTDNSVVSTRNYKYGQLIYESRNIQRVFDDNRRMNLLRHGKAAVLDFLRVKFPLTKHDGNSFRVDVISTAVSIAKIGLRIQA